MPNAISPTPAAVSTRLVSASIFLQKIANWDGRSQDIGRALTTALEAGDYLDCIKDLRGHNIDPQSYINSLDKIIDTLPPDSKRQKRCIRALKKTCGLYGILPASYTVTSAPSKCGPRPFASGRFADVWRLTDEKNHDLVFAVKSLRVYERDPLEKINKRFCREVIVCKRAKHANILSIEGVAPKLFEFCMVSQWMPNGNMLEYLKKYPGVNRLDLLIGVTHGLDYLHSNEVIHGDLKSPNILIDANGSPRLSGFNLWPIMRNIGSANAPIPNRGSAVRYRAPELLEFEGVVGAERRPTKKSDVYSLSMVIVELTTGKIPFPELVDLIATLMISKGKRPPKPRRFEAKGMTPAVWRIAKKCWHEKAEERPEVNAILRYLEDIASTANEKSTSSPSPFRQAWRDMFSD